MDKNDIRKWISENEQDLFCDPEEPKYIPSPVVEDFIDELTEKQGGENKEMILFNKDWWNCFLSYTDELAQIQRDFDVTANAQLKAAGVEKKEIEGILKTEIMSDKTRELLTEYKDNLK